MLDNNICSISNTSFIITTGRQFNLTKQTFQVVYYQNFKIYFIYNFIGVSSQYEYEIYHNIKRIIYDHYIVTLNDDPL